MNKKIIFNSTNFPPPPPPKSSTLPINPMMVKLGELINKLSEVKDHLANLEAKHNKFDQFMLEKNSHDGIVIKKINDLFNNHMNLKKNVVQHNSYVDRHENLFCKLLIPMFEDLFSFIAGQNLDKRDNSLDVDLKCKPNRYLVQMKKAIEDIQSEETLRIVGVYEPENQDGKKAEIFLEWADMNFLAPFTPETSTSLRSNRVIDYALAAGLSIDIQSYSELFSSQLSATLKLRNTSSPAALIAPSGHIIKDPKDICEVAADFYENFFGKSHIVKPHPYTDSPPIEYDNIEESIPEVTLDELVFTVQAKR
ncbi:unnamed protein product [Rotaria sp. Silwood2]|nr:unnamed protein product [Rotaria sp. Silwood2]CAF4483636.1 unnamed protein product [Rotaria sp. Silwood2]CAF4533531.1 unnamed protein product [Rotaria sp. Silwood2]CAF4563224.1 unnamed protein product [Rotaria sp. Silwood2]